VERWEQVEAIFHEALQLAPAQRDAYLRQACGGDGTLLIEIAELLAHHEQDTGFQPWAAAAAAQLISSPASLKPGQPLGPYRIESFVAAGGMGQVYRATDTRLDREVAIKICTEPFGERFAREASAIASLNHPHICHLYDVGPNYLVMEFVEGAPLRGPLPLKQAVEYAGQILDALNAAHRKGITHRDLKPANILVTRQGIKLLDFGLAKRSRPLQESGASSPTAQTEKGQILGTLHYMSPEQLQGDETDGRSDLFSFGCVLHEMLTGKRAFDGPSPAAVIAAILERDPAPSNVTLPLQQVMKTCLAKDPDHRFQDALDLKRALNWAVEQPITTPPNQRAWISVVAAATLAVGMVAGWALSNLHRVPADEPVLQLQIEPPPGGRFVFGGSTYGEPAISPDGKMAAFTASVDGKIGLWVRPLDGGSARLLPGTENAGQPFWSADSRSIAFDALNRLRRVESEGGAPADIVSLTAMRGASWSRDGYILFSALSPASGRFSVFRVSASGGTAALVAAPDPSRGELAFRWPQALSGGRFLYVVEGTRPDMTGLYAGSLAKPVERVKLLTTESKAVYASDATGNGYLLWMRSGALVAQEFDREALRLVGEPHEITETFKGTSQGEMHVDASANGRLLYGAYEEATEFAWWDRTGHRLGKVGQRLDGIRMFRLSPDERRIVVQRLTGGVQDLWLLDVERGVATRFTSDDAVSMEPVWSPDGQVILFTHFGSGELLRKPVNGGGDQQVVGHRSESMFPLDWSVDGRWLLTRVGQVGGPRSTSKTTPDTHYDTWRLRMTPDGKLDDGVAPAPYLRTRFNVGMARFSPEPNPRWVAYVSDEAGQPDVYIDAFPEPRSKVRISTSGGEFPKWGTEGRELFYVTPDNRLMDVSLKPGSGTVEASRELFTLPLRSAAGATYEPSRDGQRFLVLTNPEAAGQSLTVIVNWPALLRKGSPALRRSAGPG
jgi:Tol biopolymer transport system component/predicted Ser/Thr protein kinase